MVVYILPPNAKTLLGLFCNSNSPFETQRHDICQNFEGNGLFDPTGYAYAPE